MSTTTETTKLVVSCPVCGGSLLGFRDAAQLEAFVEGGALSVNCRCGAEVPLAEAIEGLRR